MGRCAPPLGIDLRSEQAEKLGAGGAPMTKRILVLLALSVALAAGSGARAQVMLDLTKVTCDQFVKYQVANPKFIAMWLSGYYHGKRGETMIDTQKLIADAD